MTLAEAIAHEDWAASTAHGELADEHAQMRDWLRELERLRDENAKLRELVRDMYEMAYPEYPSAFDAAFADRMRELGVEVDNG